MNLFNAIQAKDEEQLLLCISQGMDVNGAQQVQILGVKYEMIPLIEACEIDFIQGVALLLKHGADVNKRDNEGRTSLHYAVWKSVEMVRLLCDHGANVHATTKDWYSKQTPLHYAAEYGDQVDICKELIARGADVYSRDIHGNIPFHECVRCDHVNLVTLFLNESPRMLQIPDRYGFIAIHLAHTPAVLLACLRAGAQVSARGPKGRTALHMATELWTRDVSMIRILLDHGADVNVQSNKGDTPFCSAWNGHYTEKLYALLENGADPDLGYCNPYTTYPRIGSLADVRKRYRSNRTLLLLMSCVRIPRIGFGSHVRILSVDVIRMLHTFLR